MDERLKRLVANGYPYPVTIDFMRLNTQDFREEDMKRLDKLLNITENTIHFLALIALSDLLEARINIDFPIPDDFKQRFRINFTRTSMGKWGELLRESIKIFKANGFPMFVEELGDFFVKGKKGISPAQNAFNRLTAIRNKVHHKDEHLSKTEIKWLCKEAEENLEILLEKLTFISDYKFLYVSKITVDYPRWSKPIYIIDYSNISGNNPELFDLKSIRSTSLVNTPAVIVIRDDASVYLNLGPLIIYSDEGKSGIPDIFMFMDWEKGKTIKYKPIWKGGMFNLLNARKGNELTENLLLFFNYFATEKDFKSFKSTLNTDNKY